MKLQISSTGNKKIGRIWGYKVDLINEGDRRHVFSTEAKLIDRQYLLSVYESVYEKYIDGSTRRSLRTCLPNTFGIEPKKANADKKIYKLAADYANKAQIKLTPKLEDLTERA